MLYNNWVELLNNWFLAKKIKDYFNHQFLTFDFYGGKAVKNIYKIL